MAIQRPRRGLTGPVFRGMSNPLLTQHTEAVARLYEREALALVANISRTGVRAEYAAEGVTHAFELLSQRPDLTMGGRDPIAWITSVARNHAQRLQLQGLPVPTPRKRDAPDLLDALKAQPKKPRRRTTTAPTSHTPQRP